MGLWSAVLRKPLALHERVVAHILDPIAGYSNRELRVGIDIDPDTVRRLGEDGEIFVVVDYHGGVPTAAIRTRDQWLRAQAKQAAVHVDVDPSVWRKREELKIG
jgi:hypothetical protein